MDLFGNIFLNKFFVVFENKTVFGKYEKKGLFFSYFFKTVLENSF